MSFYCSGEANSPSGHTGISLLLQRAIMTYPTIENQPYWSSSVPDSSIIWPDLTPEQYKTKKSRFMFSGIWQFCQNSGAKFCGSMTPKLVTIIKSSPAIVNSLNGDGSGPDRSVAPACEPDLGLSMLFSCLHLCNRRAAPGWRATGLLYRDTDACLLFPCFLFHHQGKFWVVCYCQVFSWPEGLQK